MSFVRYVPLIAGVVLAVVLLSIAPLTVPPSKISSVTIRVGYPDSLDESDVSDLWAYTYILAPQGINVVPTFYDAPYLACKGLISGQQDIALVNGACVWGSDAQGLQLTTVTQYSLGGTFLMVAGDNITSPQQLAAIGGAVDDFGPGSETRALDTYWFNISGIPTQTVGPKPGTVYLRTSGGNIARVYDLEHGIVQAITVDDFILKDLESPSVNNTANHGPFHVLFYSPINIVDTPYIVTDNWLSNPANQQLLVKFIAAIIEAQRFFISDPQAAVQFMGSQLPLTSPSEIEFTSTFYPAHMTYWPYGAFNLQGNMSVQDIFQTSNRFYLVTGIVSHPLSNNSVPFGIINGYFERLALEKLGPFEYPCEPWVTPSFAAMIKAWVPSWEGGVSSKCSSGIASQIIVGLEWLFNIGLQGYAPSILLSEGKLAINIK